VTIQDILPPSDRSRSPGRIARPSSSPRRSPESTVTRAVQRRPGNTGRPVGRSAGRRGGRRPSSSTPEVTGMEIVLRCMAV
jgi:hypothetical protein